MRKIIIRTRTRYLISFIFALVNLLAQSIAQQKKASEIVGCIRECVTLNECSLKCVNNINWYTFDTQMNDFDCKKYLSEVD